METEQEAAPRITQFNRSPSIGQLALALSKAQGQMKGAIKDSANPFFKSKYADLASIWEASQVPLSSNELCVMQFPSAASGGVEVETVLAHSSGEWVSQVLWVPVSKMDAQGVGSAITYARRYGRAAIVGVVSEDDDGNAAAASVANLKSRGTAILEAAAKKGPEGLVAAWKSMSPEMRRECESVKNHLKENMEPAHAAN